MKKQKSKKQVRPVEEILPDSPDMQKSVPRVKKLKEKEREPIVAVDRVNESIDRTHYGTIEEPE